MKFFIDAGHSIKDPGAVALNTSESMEARKIRDYVVRGLTAKGILVYQVPDNLNLLESIKFVNKNSPWWEKGNVCLAIHLNAGGGEGAEIFRHANDKSLRAINFLNEYCRKTAYKNRGAKTEKQSHAKRLAWIDDTRPRAYLLEACFVDNKTDLDFLHRNLNIVGDAIINAISNLF